MAYITQSKLKEITYRYKIPVGSFVELYKSKITILDGVEQNKLLQIRCIIEGIDEINLELFEKIAPSRSKKLVYDSKPSYHNNCNCKLLMADYENFYIPDEIISRGDMSIEDFKSWFKTNRNVLNKDEGTFEMRWNLKWGFPLSIKALRQKNTGFVLFDNLTSEQLENKIDAILVDAKRYARKYPFIIPKYGKYAKKSLDKKTFAPYVEGFEIKEVKSILQAYVNEIQDPLMRLLISWYRAKQNPELNFDTKILDQLGFKSCPVCSSKIKTEKYSIESHDTNEVLFNELRKLRSEISKGRPAYLVFNDKTLREISLKAPKSSDEFARINGVGPVKVDSYGKIFIDCIKAFEAKKGRDKKSLGTLGQI
jgi:hypothetical protein